MKKLLLLFACISCIYFTSGQRVETYNNPVIRGDLADPTIIRIGNTYYATGTSSEWAPYYPMFKSNDLINWKQTGHIFNKQPEWTLSSFWAPELFYHNNKVYVYYTARDKNGVSYIGVATSDNPEKELTDHGLLVKFGKEAIDAFVMEDNGDLYITWKAYGLDKRPIELLCNKMSKDGLRLEGEPFTLLRDDDHTLMEGQYWFKKGDYYYLMYATNNCCGPKSDYQVYVARSKTLKGPYEKYEGNPILTGSNDILSCGHGTVTTTPDGRMFYLCHAYLNGAGFFTGRQPILLELTIDKDQWLRFKSGDIAQLQQPVPFPGTKQKIINEFRDNFKSKKLKNDWCWNYLYSDIDTKTGNGYLLLSGTQKNNSQNGTALCVRSVKPNYSFETQVTNSNKSLKGLTFYGDDKNLVILGYQNNELILKEVKDGKENIIRKMNLPTNKPYLKIKITEGCNCSFFWSKNQKDWHIINTDKNGYNQLDRWDRVARPGLIHCGESDQPAEFSYFIIQ